MFDAEGYLRALIDHLVALARRTDIVRDQVESAAAALAAAGLIAPRQVSVWGERAIDGLEAAGLVARISTERSVQATVRAVRSDAGESPPNPRRNDEPLEFIRVVPVGREFTLPDRGRLILLSLALWNRAFDLHYAVLDGDEATAWRVLGRGAERRWGVVDDGGMRYQTAGAGGAGRRMSVQFVPAVREGVSSLRLALMTGEQELVVVGVEVR